MGYHCDNCGKQRSVVYCRSDTACLCLSCDRRVHSANTIALRHSRTLICEKCNSQPASIRCVDENISLCQNCDWTSHANLESVSLHKLQSINCFSGCLSAVQISRIWPFLECSTCEEGIDTVSVDVADNCGDSSIGIQMNNIELQRVDDPSIWVLNDVVQNNTVQQPLRSISSVSSMNCYVDNETAELELNEDEDNIIQEFNIEELDLDIENYKKLFGVAHENQDLAENNGIGGLFGTNNTSDITCQIASIAKEPSISLGTMPLQLGMGPFSNVASCSNEVGGSGDSPVSCETDPNIYLQGDNSVGGDDHQENSENPSMVVLNEPQICDNDFFFSPANRKKAVQRYREKKKTLKFEKKVRYTTRKARADVRKRVSGRFVKADEFLNFD